MRNSFVKRKDRKGSILFELAASNSVQSHSHTSNEAKLLDCNELVHFFVLIM